MKLIRRLGTMLLVMSLALGPAVARAGVVVTGAVDDTYPALEDTALVVPAPGVLENDDHALPLLCVTSSDPTGLDGSLGSGVAADGAFTFTPLANTNGPTTFTYDMADYASGSCPASVDTATVTITVTPVNDAPTAVLVEPCTGGFNVAENSGAYTQSGTAHCTELRNWGPVDEVTQSLVEWVVLFNHPELFSVAPSISKFDDTFGKLQFTPAPNAHGSATVTVRGRDSGGTDDGGVDLSPQLTFSISINDPPTATADNFIVLKDRTLNVGVPGVLINDSDVNDDPLTAVKVTNPAHGVVFLQPDGSFSYTPTIGYEGLDAFSYQAFDGSLASPTRVVSLTVTAIPPVATPTPIPTATPVPTATPDATVGNGVETLSPSPSDGALPSGEPSAAPSLPPGETAQPSAASTLEPGASPAPGAVSDGGGPSLPVLLVIVLFALLVGFGAALYIPKWLKAQRDGPPDRDD